MTYEDTWDNATVVAGPSFDYNGGGGAEWRLWYAWTPPASPEITSFSTSEPYGYISVYSGATFATMVYVGMTESDVNGNPTTTGSFVADGSTYHLEIYPSGVPDYTTDYTFTSTIIEHLQGKWSEWITPPLAYVGATRTAQPTLYHNVNGAGEHWDLQPISNYILAQGEWSNDTWFKEFVQFTVIPYVDLPFEVGSPNWPLERIALPAAMSSLIYGVDYVERADVPLSDTANKWVEYAPGNNTGVGWMDYAVTAKLFTDYGSGAWVVGVTYDGQLYNGGGFPDYQTTPNPWITTWPGPANGIVANGNSITTPLDGAWHEAAPPPPIPDYVRTVTFFIDSDSDGSHAAEFFNLRFQYQMPDYRYWIPGGAGPIPLRQKQRNDGLGRSAVRARGNSSRQSSTRQRGYL